MKTQVKLKVLRERGERKRERRERHNIYIERGKIERYSFYYRLSWENFKM